MEIKCTNFELDTKIFQKNEIYGLYDKNSNFINNRFNDIQIMEYNPRTRVKWYLLSIIPSKRKILKLIKKEFEIDQTIEKKKMGELSSEELALTLIAKSFITKSKVIILDHIDAFLTMAKFKEIILHIKNIISHTDKTVIVSANKIDNIITTTSNYIIVSEDRIVYNGSNIESMHEPTEIIKFVNTANKKGANLGYYKDSKDLLKAIYRSVKK